ncbi:MAG: MFS transporter [Crocinitomicaceae bacterium]
MEKGNKRVVNAWAFYDWANSVYPLVVSTSIFPIFYETVTGASPLGIGKGPNQDLVSFLGFELANTALYSFVVAASFIVVSFVSPILSGVADYSGSKKGFLKFFCYLGAISTATLYFFDANHLEWSMLSIFFASIGFWNSLVFYNAYLPEIAEPKDHDRISAKGFSMGYFGASLLLIICLLLMGNLVPDLLPFKMPAKASFLLVALWWVGFSQITYRRLPAPKHFNKVTKEILGNGFKELKKVWDFIKGTKQLKRYLFSFFVFSMGVQTIMLMAVLFAKKVVFTDGDSSGLIIAVLIIQFIAIPGAYLFSFLSKKIGNINTLIIALVVWVGVCVFAYAIVESQMSFYMLAGVVGFVMGGTQSLSRSTYSKFLPETEDTASFFSFFDITEKIGIVIGMVAFGVMESLFGDIRASVLALIVFFIVGVLLLFRVPKLGDSLEG